MPTICQHLYTLGVEVKFTRNGEDCGGLSDCEELVILILNETDYWRYSEENSERVLKVLQG